MCCKQRMLKQIKINTCPFFPFITLSPVLRGKCFHIIVVMGQKSRDDTDTGMRAPASGESKQRDADMYFR